MAITDSSGTTINRYDEYGKPQTGNSGRFQYTGQAWLAEFGLYYFKARMYAPHLGRFMQTDPIGTQGGINLYAYTGNDPINGSDPSGLQCGWEHHTVDLVNTATGQVDEHLYSYVVTHGCDTMTGADFTGLGGNTIFPAPPLFNFLTSKAFTVCVGKANFTAVGGKQAQAEGALFSHYPNLAGGSIRGGTFGTVGVQKGFLGLTTRQLRTWGTQIYIFPDAQALISSLGGPTGGLSVSDYGNANVQANPMVAFDIYRFATTDLANDFGRKTLTTGILFPAASGGQCPKSFSRYDLP